jgi:hypothetical protein
MNASNATVWLHPRARTTLLALACAGSAGACIVSDDDAVIEAKPPQRASVTTGAATAVAETVATLNGSLNPRNSPTEWWFEYGTTTAYGSMTSIAQQAAANTSISVAADVTALSANTTYHFRLVARNARATVYGADATFSTTGTVTPPPPPPSSGTCTNPTFSTSSSNGGIGFDVNGDNVEDYYVHNNLWNAASYPGPLGTTKVCNFNSWSHTAVADNSSGDGAVKTYPNVHRDYTTRRLSSFSVLTSTFAGTAWGTGIYNVSYDVWLNGYSDELMIWTENHDQRPAGNRVASNLVFSGITWDLWATSDNSYLALTAPLDSATGRPANRVTGAGTLDLRAMLGYLVSNGRLDADPVVTQIGYGVEVVSTGGVARNFNVTEFSIKDQ